MAISTIVARGFGSFGGGLNKLPTRGYGIGVAAVTYGGATRHSRPEVARRKVEPESWKQFATWTRRHRRFTATVNYQLVIPSEPTPVAERLLTPVELEPQTEVEPIVQAPIIPPKPQILIHPARWPRARRRLSAAVRFVHNDDAEALAILGIM